jgi:hypothetical protein
MDVNLSTNYGDFKMRATPDVARAMAAAARDSADVQTGPAAELVRQGQIAHEAPDNESEDDISVEPTHAFCGGHSVVEFGGIKKSDQSADGYLAARVRDHQGDEGRSDNPPERVEQPLVPYWMLVRDECQSRKRRQGQARYQFIHRIPLLRRDCSENHNEQLVFCRWTSPARSAHNAQRPGGSKHPAATCHHTHRPGRAS